MTVHEQFADDLSLYALGALLGEERLAVERHLKECFACQHEVEQLRGDLACWLYRPVAQNLHLRSRERLMAAIAKEPRRAQVRLLSEEPGGARLNGPLRPQPSSS